MITIYFPRRPNIVSIDFPGHRGRGTGLPSFALGLCTVVRKCPTYLRSPRGPRKRSMQISVPERGTSAMILSLSLFLLLFLFLSLRFVSCSFSPVLSRLVLSVGEWRKRMDFVTVGGHGLSTSGRETLPEQQTPVARRAMMFRLLYYTRSGPRSHASIGIQGSVLPETGGQVEGEKVAGQSQ